MQPWSMKDERVFHMRQISYSYGFYVFLPSAKYVHVFVHELNKYVNFYGRQEHQQDPWIWKKCQEWFIIITKFSDSISLKFSHFYFKLMLVP